LSLHKQLKEGASIVAAAGQLIETTKARLHLMESKKTDRDTTVRIVFLAVTCIVFHVSPFNAWLSKHLQYPGESQR
jgi:hypothetical protein